MSSDLSANTFFLNSKDYLCIQLNVYFLIKSNVYCSGLHDCRNSRWLPYAPLENPFYPPTDSNAYLAVIVFIGTGSWCKRNSCASIWHAWI